MITEGFHAELSKAISQARNSILVVSPYVTEQGARVILESLKRSKLQPPHLCFVTLPQGPEYITGFVDTAALLALQRGRFEVRVLDALHAKIYMIDDATAFIGSSNVTAAGLGSANEEQCNKEVMVQVTLSPHDAAQIRREFLEVALSPNPPLNEEYVLQMKSMADMYKEESNELIKKFPLPPKTDEPDVSETDDIRVKAIKALQRRGVIEKFKQTSHSDFCINDNDVVKVLYSAMNLETEKYTFNIVQSTGKDIRDGKYSGILLVLGEDAVLGLPTGLLKRKILIRQNQKKSDRHDWQFRVMCKGGRWNIQLRGRNSKELVEVSQYLWEVPMANGDGLRSI